MNSGEPVTGNVEAAIERVLAAQADAVLAVRNAEIEAQRDLEAARARARRVDEHASERLQRILLRIEADCVREVAHTAAASATVAPDIEHDADRLTRVVESMAAELTGAGP